MKIRNWAVLFLSIAALAADKKDSFSPGPVESYSSKMTSDKVTIAAEPFYEADKSRSAFDKLDMNEYGVLPMLVVIKNNSDKTIKLDSMKVEFVTADREHVEAVPSHEVQYLEGGRARKVLNSPLPTGGPRLSNRKGKLTKPEIITRAFAAKMLPPGDSASGFFYFQTGFMNKSQLYITGITEAGTGRELFYFEIPLSQ